MVSEGATLMVALSAARKGAKEANTTLYEYGKGNLQYFFYISTS